eukprot:8776-Rhodomonas_salina.1
MGHDGASVEAEQRVTWLGGRGPGSHVTDTCREVPLHSVCTSREGGREEGRKGEKGEGGWGC